MSQATSIRLTPDLKRKLSVRAKLEHRSLSNQIEASLMLALAAEENSDLPLQFIKDIMAARADREMGLARPFRVC